MMLRLALFLAALAPAAGRLTAGSRLGTKLLSKARRLNQDVAFDWVADYSIVFDKCHSLIQVAEEENDERGMIYTYNLVTFHLCPTSSCSTSGSTAACAQYVVNMVDFVDMWTESKMAEQEQLCENIRENCYNDDEYTCYTNAGHEECYNMDGGDEFEVQRYLECNEMENANGNNNNNNNYNQQFYIGPYCADGGKEILLGVFYDQGCSVKAEDGLAKYEAGNYNQALPFSAESLIQKECMSCEAVDENADDNNNNNNNGQEEKELIEMCDEMYQQAGKCEANIQGLYYQDTSGCNYINNILPKLDEASRSITGGGSSKSSTGTTAKAFAWIFAFSTLALGVYAFLLFRKLRRSKVDLSAQTNAEMN